MHTVKCVSDMQYLVPQDVSGKVLFTMSIRVTVSRPSVGYDSSLIGQNTIQHICIT